MTVFLCKPDIKQLIFLQKMEKCVNPQPLFESLFKSWNDTICRDIIFSTSIHSAQRLSRLTLLTCWFRQKVFDKTKWNDVKLSSDCIWFVGHAFVFSQISYPNANPHPHSSSISFEYFMYQFSFLFRISVTLGFV